MAGPWACGDRGLGRDSKWEEWGGARDVRQWWYLLGWIKTSLSKLPRLPPSPVGAVPGPVLPTECSQQPCEVAVLVIPITSMGN